MIINIEENWKNILQPEFDKESFKNLSRFVNSEYVNNICYPEEKNIFSAFCPSALATTVKSGSTPKA